MMDQKGDDVEYVVVPNEDDVELQRYPSTTAKAKPLSLLPLIALIFFEVSGGPFGTEDAVSAGGPLLVLLGFLILPLVWSVPEALITAELATAFPENSGYVAWVTAAFGPFWGFQEGFWSWLSGVTDNSIYPVMLADNLRLFFPILNDGWPRMAFLLTLSISLTYLNYRGLHVVGGTAMTTTLFIVAPFVLLCVLAAPQADASNWVKVDWPNVQWGTFLNIMFWNLNYWDNVSTLAGEVENPSRTFPRALMWAVLLVVSMYFLPTLAALGVMPDTGDWQLGYYGKVAQQVGGNWLAWWVVAAAAASQVGQFQAEMSADSYQLQGMAERGFLPRALARRSRHGTPTLGILASSVGVACLASFSFVDIVELLNAVYCLAELLEFAAFLWLRIKAPNLPRPYRVPLPVWGLALMLAPASALLVVLLALPAIEGNWTMMAATFGALASGFILYPLLTLAKELGWCEFATLEYDFSHAATMREGGRRRRRHGVDAGQAAQVAGANGAANGVDAGGSEAGDAGSGSGGTGSGESSPGAGIGYSYTISATGHMGFENEPLQVEYDGRRRSVSINSPLLSGQGASSTARGGSGSSLAAATLGRSPPAGTSPRAWVPALVMPPAAYVPPAQAEVAAAAAAEVAAPPPQAQMEVAAVVEAPPPPQQQQQPPSLLPEASLAQLPSPPAQVEVPPVQAPPPQRRLQQLQSFALNFEDTTSPVGTPTGTAGSSLRQPLLGPPGK